MPRLGTLYTAMEPRMRRLPRRRPVTAADIIKPAFRLECDRRLEIYYAPMDWLRPAARVAIVGITPGRGTMVIAHQTAVAGLAAGRSPAAILNEVKSRAVFSGFRRPLITRLEYLGVHRHLGLESAAELWTPAGERLLQSTTAIRYPAFVDGEDYGGRNPALTSSPVLRRYVCELLAPELARIPDALVIPRRERRRGDRPTGGRGEDRPGPLPRRLPAPERAQPERRRTVGGEPVQAQAPCERVVPIHCHGVRIPLSNICCAARSPARAKSAPVKLSAALRSMRPLAG